MDAYVNWFQSDGERGHCALAVLRCLGLFDRPATADCFAALLKRPAISGMTKAIVALSDTQLNLIFTRLESAKLLTVNRDAAGTLLSLDTHALLREYFNRERRTRHRQAWCEAHRRLYEHLCTITPDNPQPTLEDLQPLYQAVGHGCQAGLQTEAFDKVFVRRIWHGTQSDGFYSVSKLGAVGSDLGALACFFVTPWRQVHPVFNEIMQASIVGLAATRLRALGRLTEATEPMRTALAKAICQQAWRLAAGTATNLSELEVALGKVAQGVEDAEQSVTYADYTGEAFLCEVARTTHADALHLAGRRAEAENRFCEAERMHAASQPSYPLLYSVRGFQYCDLRLTHSRRAAWQRCLSLQPLPSTLNHLHVCRAVSQRVAQTLKWGDIGYRQSLLDLALDHLTLGRAGLYADILKQSEIGNTKSEIEAAVAGLRRAGQQDMLPLGLCTRAWLRFLTDVSTGLESAQADLDEAWEIAERGPMRLHMADIHLYRARLFFRKKPYPWKSPQEDLAAAEKLIKECGYHRRDEELADAKRAILGA